MKHKDMSVEISLRRFVSLSDFVPEPMFQVNITNPAGKDTAVMFGELSDALHLVARVFSPKVTEEEKVTKVTKRNRSKNPKGFMDDWVLKMLKKNPISLVEHAVRGMLPKNRLGRAIFKNMHVYAGASHPHEAQKPKKIEL